MALQKFAEEMRRAGLKAHDEKMSDFTRMLCESVDPVELALMNALADFAGTDR